jgi:hypothetical protein
VSELSETAIRTELLKDLAAMTSSHHFRLLEEFWIPTSQERADVVRVDGALSCFEIKSDRDRLTRLPRQVAAFGRIFDRASVVVTSRHLARAKAIVEPWWGIIEATSRRGSTRFDVVRRGLRNPHTDYSLQLQLLWRSELAKADTSAKNKSMSRDELRRVLLNKHGDRRIGLIVRSALVERDLALRRW